MRQFRENSQGILKDYIQYFEKTIIAVSSYTTESCTLRNVEWIADDIYEVKVFPR